MLRLWSRPWVVNTSERIMLLLPANLESLRGQLTDMYARPE
jgi:hypothetical protein